MAHLAIAGGKPVHTRPFVSWPIHGEAERAALLRVLESGNWGGFPSPNFEASAFAKDFAAHHDARFGVCAANGTLTLLLALRAGGIARGDEVIVPPITFVATAAAAVYAGAVPVFADVRRSDYTLDPVAVEAAVTDRTRAVICVHLGASVCDLDRLTELCERRGLLLVEDCAHMHGAKWKGRGVGSVGAFGSFSFQSSKLMTAGEGGIVLTNDEKREAQLQSLVNCGRREMGYESAAPAIGHNFRITEFQAAVLRCQLARLDEQNAKRARGFERLAKALAEIPGFSALEVDARVTQRAGYQFVLRCERERLGGKSKERILDALRAEGIPADGGYAPLHKNHELFPAETLRQWYDAGARLPDPASARCPVAEKAADEIVTLPQQLFLGEPGDVESVIEACAKISRHASEL